MSTDSRNVVPPDGLEARVVGALRARGLIKPSRLRQVWKAAGAAAAAIAIFTSGFVAGNSRSETVTVARADPRFVLLLHETADSAAASIAEERLVDEYRDWARGVRARGHAIHGEKLKDEAGQTLAGFFVIEAPSFADARALADSCPHVRYGGRIDVREIDPT